MSQLAVLLVCQTPLKSGLPSAVRLRFATRVGAAAPRLRTAALPPAATTGRRLLARQRNRHDSQRDGRKERGVDTFIHSDDLLVEPVQECSGARAVFYSKSNRVSNTVAAGSCLQAGRSL